MMSNQPSFTRPLADLLRARLAEPRRLIQAVLGPRQVGKTTLVEQVVAAFPGPVLVDSADAPTLRDRDWIPRRWDEMRRLIRDAGGAPGVLVLDEIQKAEAWSETVKRRWDEDTRGGVPLHVVLLGSAPLLVQQGLTESLAGRFEVLQATHWSLAEMAAAFGWSLEQYLYFGGYPGAAPLAADEARWRRYVLDSLVETTIARDVLLLTRVDKPALLRRLFDLACRASGQVVSYTKMVGELADAGNTTTLAGYLHLLAGAGMVTGLPKYSGGIVRQRGSPPKLLVLNTALMTAVAGVPFAEAMRDGAFRGRLVESAVGAHLAAAAFRGELELAYWREGTAEVDFVVTRGRTRVAIEVKSGAVRRARAGLDAFVARYPRSRTLVVGGDEFPLERFLRTDPSEWLDGGRPQSPRADGVTGPH